MNRSEQAVTAWALAPVNQSGKKLLAAWAGGVDLANTGGAFAKGEPVEHEAVCGFGVEWRACEFKPQESANTAWAFATVSMSSAKLFAAGARGAE